MIFQIVLQPTQSLATETTSDGSSIGSMALAVLVVVAVMAGGIAIHNLLRKLRRPELDGLTPERVKRLWDQILQSAKQGKLGGKIAIIEADKLVDNVMKSMLIPGETMGERLKMAAHKYPGIRDLWPAHRVRNRLVHETDYELREGDALILLEDFRKALRELNVM